MTIAADAKVGAEALLGKFIGLTPVKTSSGAEQSLEYQIVYLSSNLASTAPNQP